MICTIALSVVDTQLLEELAYHGDIYGEQTYKLIRGLETTLGDRKDLLRSCSSSSVPSIVMTFVDGRDVSNECEQLQNAGKFDNPLLNADESPGLIEYYSIMGKVDGVGDEVVTSESAHIDGAVFNRVVECDHFALKEPTRCPEGYKAIVEALGYDGKDIEETSFLIFARNMFFGAVDFVSGFWE